MAASNPFPPAYVDAGLLLSFGSDLTPEHQDDILNSILLAQLAADKKFSKFNLPRDWYGFYGNTLSNLAWQVTGFAFEVYKPTGRFYLKEVIEKQFATRVGAREQKAVMAAIEQYNQLAPKSKARLIFSLGTQRSESDSELINAQVGVAWGHSDLSVVGTIFETDQCITDLFQDELDPELIHGDMQIVASSGTLNETVYQTLRKSVIEKLGPKREEFIVSLKIEERLPC